MLVWWVTFFIVHSVVFGKLWVYKLLLLALNPLWVLAFSVILFRSILSLHNFLHPIIPTLCISSSASSIHLFLGLPLILLPVGFHSNTHFGVFFFHPSTSLYLAKHSSAFYKSHYAFSVSSFSSWFILILQDPSSFCTGPKIFLNILRSNILRYCSSRFVNVQASHPYVTTGLIKVSV